MNNLMWQGWYKTDLHVEPAYQEIGSKEIVIITFGADEDATGATCRLYDFKTKALTTGQPGVSFSTGTDVATVTVDGIVCGVVAGRLYEVEVTFTYPDTEKRIWLKALPCIR